MNRLNRLHAEQQEVCSSIWGQQLRRRGHQTESSSATDIITLESVIFPMRFCVYIKIISSSSNNIFYIQIHHFTQQTMLNQTVYYTIRLLAVLYLFSQPRKLLPLSNEKVR